MLTSKEQAKKMPLFIKLISLSCLGLLFAFTTISAEKVSLEKVYHVYIDSEYIGKVSNRNIIKGIVEEKIEIKQKKHKDLKFVTDESISIVPEKVFDPIYDNKKVSRYLDDHLTIKAKVVQLNVDGETLGYFNSKEDAEDILKTYQLKFLDEKELATVQEEKKKNLSNQQLKTLNSDKEDNPSSNEKEDLLKLSVNEKKIKDIFFSEDIEITEQNTSPENILNKDQGIKLLTKGSLEEKKHKVGKGDVLGSIANTYDLTMKKLLELNPNIAENTILQIGQEINVTEYEPIVDVITIEEELLEEEVPYKTDIKESDNMYKGEERVSKKGKNGKRKAHYEIEKRNGQTINKSVLDEKIIEKPVNKVIVRGTKVIPSQGSGEFVWPTNGGYISSHMGKRWGRLHRGIDIAKPNSRTIMAADHGVIQSAGVDGSYGNKIIINHNNGMRTLYAHLSSINVKVGQKVEKGMEIGKMGSTGNSTGIHLHFEVYQNGALQNPMKYY